MTRCVACGAPATRRDRDGVPLCEGDWEHLVEHGLRDAEVVREFDVAAEIGERNGGRHE